MHPQSKLANEACLDALRKAHGDITSPADEHLIDAIEALRRGLYGPDYPSNNSAEAK